MGMFAFIELILLVVIVLVVVLALRGTGAKPPDQPPGDRN